MASQGVDYQEMGVDEGKLSVFTVFLNRALQVKSMVVSPYL